MTIGRSWIHISARPPTRLHSGKRWLWLCFAYESWCPHLKKEYSNFGFIYLFSYFCFSGQVKTRSLGKLLSWSNNHKADVGVKSSFLNQEQRKHPHSKKWSFRWNSSGTPYRYCYAEYGWGAKIFVFCTCNLTFVLGCTFLLLTKNHNWEQFSLLWSQML